MPETAIEWADRTVNFVTGCTRVSEGCRHCYAERMSGRLAAMGQSKYAGVSEGRRWSGKLSFHPEAMDEPERVKRPAVWFVNSMSDTFHADVPGELIREMIERMRAMPRHRFLLLTKRPENMRTKLGEQFFAEKYTDDSLPRNVGIGVSIEHQAAANRRIRSLINTVYVCGMRFISAEPLLGPIDLTEAIPLGDQPEWIICGGESGPGARPMHPEWVDQLQRDASARGIPFFFKQWGRWKPIVPAHYRPSLWKRVYYPNVMIVQRDGTVDAPDSDGCRREGAWVMAPVGKKAAGRSLAVQPKETRPERWFAGRNAER